VSPPDTSRSSLENHDPDRSHGEGHTSECRAGFGHACAGPSQGLQGLRGADFIGGPVAREHGILSATPCVCSKTTEPRYRAGECSGRDESWRIGVEISRSGSHSQGPTYHEHVSLDETSIARVGTHVLVAAAERHLESKVAELEEGERHAAVTVDLPHQREEAL
jgi:hypothetical protein